MQESLPQEAKSRSAIHDALVGLQFVDFALDDTLSPGQTEGGFDSVIIALNSDHKAFQFANAASSRLLQPGA